MGLAGPVCKWTVRTRWAFGLAGPVCKWTVRTRWAFGLAGPVCKWKDLGSVPELRSCGGGRPGPSLTIRTVSVDVKQL